MVMTRYDKAVMVAQRIDAARGRLAKKKAKRDAEDRKRDADTLPPDDYRKQHGRCPDGYEYDPLSDSCMSKDPEPGEPRDEQTKEERQEEDREVRESKEDRDKERGAKDKAGSEEKTDPPKLKPPPPPKTPGDWLDGRKARGDYLEKLFNEDFDKYKSEAKRMRESGELPDKETAEMLSKLKRPEDLPPEVLKDKEKLAKVLAQQDTQRRIEQMVLGDAEKKLKDLDKRRQIALKAGKKPPRIDPYKFLNDIEEQYNRNFLEDNENIEQILEDESDYFAQIVSDAATKPGEPAYWWKKWWRKVTRPIPTWTPGRGDVYDLDKLTGASMQATTAYTSSGVTNMEPREIGFPPYDRERQPRRYIQDQPSGRPAFPPYGDVVTVEYRDRDARMQGFPPYDGKGEPLDTATIGLPPYNKKQPHKGRGFPPYRDGMSVYDQRRRTVDLAVK